MSFSKARYSRVISLEKIAKKIRNMAACQWSLPVKRISWPVSLPIEPRIKRIAESQPASSDRRL